MIKPATIVMRKHASERLLFGGTILAGAFLLFQIEPIVGKAPQRQRVGVIGLGAGVLAAYDQEGDTYRFYEINPLAVEIARRIFNFCGTVPRKWMWRWGTGGSARRAGATTTAICFR